MEFFNSSKNINNLPLQMPIKDKTCIPGCGLKGFRSIGLNSRIIQKFQQTRKLYMKLKTNGYINENHEMRPTITPSLRPAFLLYCTYFLVCLLLSWRVYTYTRFLYVVSLCMSVIHPNLNVQPLMFR